MPRLEVIRKLGREDVLLPKAYHNGTGGSIGNDNRIVNSITM